MNLSQLIAKNKAVEPEAQQALPEGDSEKPKPKLGGLAGKLGAKKSTAPQGIKIGNLPATPKPKQKTVESVSAAMDLYALAGLDRKSTRLNSSHSCTTRMTSSALKKKEKT